MSSDNLMKDYHWLLKVIDSCETLEQIDGAINCYMLWSKKYSRFKKNHNIKFVSTLEKEAYTSLITKSNKLR